MGYWKSKVLPQIKKVFDKSGKKAAATEFTKSFDESKETISKEVDEKKTELEPKVLEIYESSPAEIKILLKEKKESAIKKNSVTVTKFCEELVKIEFPGSKDVSEAAAKCGPVLVSGPILFIFEKVSIFIPVEAAIEAPAVEEATREVVVEGEKKEEIEKVEGSTSEPVAEPAAEAPPAEPTPPGPAPTEPAPEPEKKE